MAAKLEAWEHRTGKLLLTERGIRWRAAPENPRAFAAERGSLPIFRGRRGGLTG
ncbi:hypothetical protein D3C83_183130 [compost metagenome]